MNFICKKNELCEAVSNVSKAVSIRSSIPALEGICLKLNSAILEITGYDLDLGINTTISVKSEDKGECIVNSRLFGEIIRKMPSEEIDIEIDEVLNVTIKGGHTKYNISAISAEEYPDLPQYDSEQKITLTQSILKNMITQTNYAVSVSDTKPILTGELFDIDSDGDFNLVAIDGFRMAIRYEKIDCNETNKFVVPSKALTEVARLLKDDDEKKCHIYVTRKHIVFDINNYLVFSRLLEGEFHNYRASLPNKFKTEVTIKTKEMMECLDRCSLLINEKNKSPIRCSFANNTVNICCSTAIGKIDEVLDCEINGDNIEIGFNNRFFIDALRASECDKVKLKMTGPKNPIELLPLEGNGFTFLLMPVQLRG